MRRTEKQELARELYQDIKDSLQAVNKSGRFDYVLVNGLPQASESILDEMARNAAQVIVLKLDLVQIEECCPICGSCPICGRREEHEH